MVNYSYSDNTTNLVKLQNYINYYKGKTLEHYKGFMDVEYNYHITDLFDNFFSMNDNENLIEFELSEWEVGDFKYNPKGLSQYIYNTPELWYLILKVNGLDHPGELELHDNKIKVPEPQALDNYLSTVYNIRKVHFSRTGQMW